MSANLENSAVATRLKKVSFHSNPKERQCRNKQRELMDLVSSLVRSLSQGKVKQDKSGKYSRLDANDKLAGACVYFLNQEQTLKEFLNSTIIPPDTNVIEGQIRPLTILR